MSGPGDPGGPRAPGDDGAARWARAQELFHAAAELPEAERRAFLGRAAGGDAALADEVLALLAEDARAGGLLDRGLADAAARVLPGDGAALPRDVGPYRLREPLGEGGMGVVWLAERRDLGSLVAIKFLRDAWLSPERRARFVNEERLLAQLNHPSIARLYDADVLPDGTPWFAMEYVDGAPIHAFCRERAGTVREKLALFRQVCEAVLHAHQHALVHRDLKPSNILVTRGGEPKLLDFGIAKSLDDLGAGGVATRTAHHWLTPAYAAPEQFRGAGLGVHTDTYALGVVLYELLAGRPPFDLENRSLAEAERIVSGQAPARPSAVAARGGLSRADWADLDVLCLTAMHRDPDRRYRTVDSLIRDIDHFLRGEPLEARPDAFGYRASKFARRHRGALATAAGVTAVIAGLVIYYTANLARARDAAVAEAGRTRRIQAFMQDLFSGGDPDAGPQDTLRVRTLLARGAREAGALSGSPEIQAELFQTLGQIHQALGDFDHADTLLAAALDGRRRHLGEDDPDVARSLVALAELRAWQSRFPEAESLARAGLERSRRRAGADPAALARATTTLGIVLENSGDYAQAIATLREAVRLDSIAGLPLNETTVTLTELANSHFYAGDYAVADSLNRRLLAIDRATYGARHPRVAGDLVNLGATRQEMSDWAGAERHYRQAHEIYRGWYGEDHFETAATLNMIGRTLVQQARLDEARAPLERALALRERIYGPWHTAVASTLNEVALLAQHSGRYADAEAAFRRMIAIYQRIYGGRHYLVGLAHSNLGSLETARGDYRAAEAAFRRGLAMYRETLPADHLYVAVTTLKLGRALLRQGRFAEAERESRAGYEALNRQPEPPHGWLQAVRLDLAQIHAGLGRPDDAERFRAERAKASADSAAAANAQGADAADAGAAGH